MEVSEDVWRNRLSLSNSAGSLFFQDLPLLLSDNSVFGFFLSCFANEPLFSRCYEDSLAKEYLLHMSTISADVFGLWRINPQV